MKTVDIGVALDLDDGSLGGLDAKRAFELGVEFAELNDAMGRGVAGPYVVSVENVGRFRSAVTRQGYDIVKIGAPTADGVVDVEIRRL